MKHRDSHTWTPCTQPTFYPYMTGAGGNTHIIGWDGRKKREKCLFRTVAVEYRSPLSSSLAMRSVRLSILLFSSKWQLLHDFLQFILLSLWCTHTQSVRVDWYVNFVGLFLCLISATFSVTFKRTGKVNERNTRKITSPTVAAACQCRSLKAFRSLKSE